MHETSTGRELRKKVISDSDVDFRLEVSLSTSKKGANLAQSINSTFIGAYIYILVASWHQSGDLQKLI